MNHFLVIANHFGKVIRQIFFGAANYTFGQLQIKSNQILLRNRTFSKNNEKASAYLYPTYVWMKLLTLTKHNFLQIHKKNVT